ncbi:hypothetical protein [Kitasatospora griseola]|uniref:hypothetical protein n=1 Tax=Kitasatospora griseola TaxID=2064 RepID=UPI003419EEF2
MAVWSWMRRHSVRAVVAAAWAVSSPASAYRSAAFVELGLVQGLLDVLRGCSGRSAADSVGGGEQGVFLVVVLVVVLVVGAVEGGWCRWSPPFLFVRRVGGCAEAR